MSKIAEVPDIALVRFTTRVIEHNRLSETGYELVLERQGLEFEAGRLLTLHGDALTEDRSYTIASGEQDPCLRVLYRLVPDGVLTPKLVQLQPGDPIDVSGSYGQFVLRDRTRPLVFIATGTGIAPCHAYVQTYADLNLTILHGVRTAQDLFYRSALEERYTYLPCLTADASTGFQGRVTDYLRQHPLSSEADYYLCGAYEMIYEAQALLLDQGISPQRIFREGYYYKLEF